MKHNINLHNYVIKINSFGIFIFLSSTIPPSTLDYLHILKKILIDKFTLCTKKIIIIKKKDNKSTCISFLEYGNNGTCNL